MRFFGTQYGQITLMKEAGVPLLYQQLVANGTV